MKARVVAAAAAAIVGGANANIQHRHAHDVYHDLEKKDAGLDDGSDACAPGVTTVWSTWLGEAALYTPSPAPESSSAVAVDVNVAPAADTPVPQILSTSTSSSYSAATPSSVPVQEAPANSPVSPVAPPPASTPNAATNVLSIASSAVASAASAALASVTGLGGKAAGQPWGITYTPYDAAGGCMSKDAVFRDIKAITAKGIDTVRVYGTDCSTLPNVGAACAEHGCKMILGIYIDAPGCLSNNPTVSQQISAVQSWNQFDMVSLISVGNEAITNGHCTASELSGLISQCKSAFSSYSGPWTTAETIGVWENKATAAALCGNIDVVGAQLHPFFNADTAASQAGALVKTQLQSANGVCPGKPAKILETGWPSAGRAMGKAVPGVAEQKEAIASLVQEVGQDAVLFSYSNDPWKSQDTACACEQHWGAASVLDIAASLS